MQAPGELVELVRGIFAAACEAERCAADETLFELGGDSVRAAEIASVLESALELPITVDVVLESLTPSALAARVADLWRAQRRDLPALSACLGELAAESASA